VGTEQTRGFREAVIGELGGALVADPVPLPHARSLERIASLHSSPGMRAGALEELGRLAREAGALKTAGAYHRKALDVPGAGGADRLGINAELASWTAQVADASGPDRERLLGERQWFAGATQQVAGAAPGSQNLACSVAKRHLDAGRPELAFSYYDAAAQIAEIHGDQRAMSMARAGIDVTNRRLGLAREPLGGRAYSTVQAGLESL
jgi:hypothetical protein